MKVNKFLVIFLIGFAGYGVFTLASQLINPPDYTMSNAQAQAYCQ